MCKYEEGYEYYDHEARRFGSFECEEREVKDGLCIFHHPEYWKVHPKEVEEKFYEKVESAIENNEDLFCIGYNLPDINLDNKFPKSVYFGFATFNGEAQFYYTMFEGKADFSEAKFNGKANFGVATFNKADFSGTTFNRQAYFGFATFNGEAEFFKADFNKAIFSDTTFNGKALFESLRRIKGNSQYGNDPILDFRHVHFGNPEEVHFDDFDLGNTSLAYTDVSKIDIGERVRWKANKKLMDERLADKGEVPYEVVATVYRRLRQNLESKLRYVEAGRFFVAEMEVKRKNVRTKNRVLKWIRINVFSALAWYKHFSNYGESYKRIILWIAVMLFLPAVVTTITQVSSLSQFTSNFQKQLQDYIFAFFQLKTDNIIELAIRILSLLLMGQLYIALRRQFERKYKI